MIVNPLTAMNGLGTMLSGVSQAGMGIAGAGIAAAAQSAPPAASFAAMLGNAAGETVAEMRGAEKLSFAALQGKAELRETVDAIMSAEQSLQAAIAIRDKIVSSYLEISRMAI